MKIISNIYCGIIGIIFNFSNYLLDNKLYWKYFSLLMNVYGQDACFQIFKLLCIKDNNKKFIKNVYNTDLQISNGTLSGTQGVAFLIEEAIVFINPLNEKLEVDSEYDIYHIIELNSTGLNVSWLGRTNYTSTYIELGYNNIDFRKIEEADYIELDKLLSLINVGFASMKGQYVAINSAILYIDVIITVLFSALMLALIVRFINPFIGFKFRFKGALDAQFISLLFMISFE